MAGDGMKFKTRKEHKAFLDEILYKVPTNPHEAERKLGYLRHKDAIITFKCCYPKSICNFNANPVTGFCKRHSK